MAIIYPTDILIVFLFYFDHTMTYPITRFAHGSTTHIACLGQEQAG